MYNSRGREGKTETSVNIQCVSTRAVTHPTTIWCTRRSPTTGFPRFRDVADSNLDGIEDIGYAGFAAPLLTKALRETVDALAG